MRHLRTRVDTASTWLLDRARRLRPKQPADLYNEVLRGAAYRVGSSIAAVLILWVQSRY